MPDPGSVHCGSASPLGVAELVAPCSRLPVALWADARVGYSRGSPVVGRRSGVARQTAGRGQRHGSVNAPVSSGSPPRCRGRSRRAELRCMASRAGSGHDPRAGGTPLSAADRQPGILTWAALQPCERGRVARALTVGEPGQAPFGTAAPQATAGEHVQARTAGDAPAEASARRVQHHLRTHPQPGLCPVATGHPLQPPACGRGRGHRAGNRCGPGRQAGREKRIMMGRSLPHRVRACRF